MAVSRGSLPQGGGATQTVAPLNSSSTTSSGTVTSPTSAQTISGVLTPPAGLYDVVAWVAVTGTTAAATDFSNMRIYTPALGVTQILPFNVGSAGNISGGGPYNLRVALNGSQTINVQAGNNATTGAIYSALIICTKVA